MADCIYLRKSRVDTEAEAHGAGDTLARHEQALLRHAQHLGRSISYIYREVVSGETISARPQMQQLLMDVECGKWDAVHVMEVERLARGDTLDQGMVSQAFLYSKTLIITPKKIYDPSNEFDEEYFEFGLFMSRREYKTINRRQQAGRLASLREGKWISNKEPYGYRRCKLEGEKGWSLVLQESEAAVIRDMFRWLTEGFQENGSLRLLGTSQIAKRLNILTVPSPGGATWTSSSVRNILRNDVYAGWVHWGRRATQKSLSNGTVHISRPRADKDSYERFPGLHQAIVSQDIYDLAQEILSSFPSRPGPQNAQTMNPMAGLVICGSCGRSMVRRPFSSGRQEVLLCPSPSCPTKSSDLQIVESVLLSVLADMLVGLKASEAEYTRQMVGEYESLQRALLRANQELSRISKQEKRTFELVEQNIYSSEQFLLRNQELSERKSVLEAEMDLIRQELCQWSTREEQYHERAPLLFHVLDAYHETEDASERNSFLKAVLSKVIYTKTRGGRYEKSNLELTLFPRFALCRPD